MKLQLKRLCRAALLVLALQPVYLLALVATDYVAPPEQGGNACRGFRPTPGVETEECVELWVSAWSPAVPACIMRSGARARWLIDGIPCDFACRGDREEARA